MPVWRQRILQRAPLLSSRREGKHPHGAAENSAMARYKPGKFSSSARSCISGSFYSKSGTSVRESVMVHRKPIPGQEVVKSGVSSERCTAPACNETLDSRVSVLLAHCIVQLLRTSTALVMVCSAVFQTPITVAGSKAPLANTAEAPRCSGKWCVCLLQCMPA